MAGEQQYNDGIVNMSYVPSEPYGSNGGPVISQDDIELKYIREKAQASKGSETKGFFARFFKNKEDNKEKPKMTPFHRLVIDRFSLFSKFLGL